ncbi:MAG TPA: efflux transporter outer membrane subunit [Quisquiliibacterium sp.]|nr:efflux transporter outer membrane subunit [Quisquiliibacterium sp.]
MKLQAGQHLRQAWRQGLGSAALSALIALGGCALVGPDHVEPQPSVPAAWAGPAPNGSGTQAPPIVPGTQAAPGPRPGLAGWWQQFNDPMLAALVDRALADSPDLRAAQARLRAAGAQLDVASAARYPAVSANASARGSGIEDAGSAQSYGAGLNASWEVDLFGRLRRGVEAAQADLEATAATLGSAQVSLAAEVALAYIDVRGLQARLDVSRRNLESQSETLQLTSWRAQAGLVGLLDVEQARASVEQVRAQIPVFEASLGQTRHRLSVLTGQPPAALAGVLERPGPIPSAPVSLALGIPAEVLRQRPDVLAAERALAAETARVGQAEAARYPSLALSGSLGLEALTLGGLTGGGASLWSIAAGLAAPVFDAGRLRAQVEIRSAVQEQAMAAYESTVLIALEEVENALLAVASNRDRFAALVTAVDAARNAALLARHRYASGLADFQSVLDSARTVRTLEDSLASSEADSAVSMVRLYKALGGGWAPGTSVKAMR